MGAAEAEQLRQFLRELAAAQVSPSQKATQFQEFAERLAMATGGAWQAVHIRATDGADVFLGRQGEVVVFGTDGSVFRGGIGSYRPTREGIELDYSKLVKL